MCRGRQAVSFLSHRHVNLHSFLFVVTPHHLPVAVRFYMLLCLTNTGLWGFALLLLLQPLGKNRVWGGWTTGAHPEWSVMGQLFS